MEAIVRSSAFLMLFFCMALWEYYLPRREQIIPRRKRWPLNLFLMVFNTLILRLTMSGAAYGTAIWAQSHDYGLLHFFSFPGWFQLGLGIVLLDLLIYWQHRLFHVVPIFWRLHRVHHADLELDVSSGARFHPLEAVLSMFIKMGAIVLLGAPPIAVLSFELILSLCATFNHGNVYLSQKLDKLLRVFLVTPDMHRIHHSVLPRESNSNYGFSVPWWDYLFSSYTAEAKEGQLGLEIGDSKFPSLAKAQSVKAVLIDIPLQKVH